MATRKEQRPPRAKKTEDNKIHIVVVEDSKPVAKILHFLIEKKVNIVPHFASSFEEARNIYVKEGNRLFAGIIDLNLPDAHDGQVADFFLKKNLPIVVLTGSDDNERHQDLVNRGIIDYVVKENRFSYGYAVDLIIRLHQNQSTKVLIAEDSKVSQRLIAGIMQRHLFQVYTAKDGIEALAIVQEHPDIKMLITDYNMPEMNGVTLTKTIRQTYDKSDLAIIGLSSEGDIGLSARFIKNGANDFLKKPFCYEEFVCRIMHALEGLEMIAKIKAAASEDFLTKLYNRRYFFEHGGEVYKRTKIKGEPISLVILDVDYFKKVNDTHGHEMGDRVLVEMAARLKKMFSNFILARIGGEEFCILMPGITAEEAFSLVDNFRNAVKNWEIKSDDVSLKVTFSAGVSDDECDNIDAHLNLADELLYDAKENGRDRVIYNGQGIWR